MPTLLRMPEVAANATDAVLQEWAVREGASFSARDALATVETEKAVVDIEAESAGVVLRTLVGAETRVEVGSPIALLAAPDESVEDIDAALSALGVQSEPSAGGAPPRRRTLPDDAEDPEGGTAATGPPETAEVEVPPPSPGRSGRENKPRDRIFASPLARRLAREAGLALEDIDGSGPRNRITRRDVEKALTDQASPGTESRTPVADRPMTERPHSPMRRAIASRLTESKQTVPHFYLRGTARVEALLDMRRELNQGAEVRVSLTDLVVKAVAQAHQLVPQLNVTWSADAVLHHASADVAVAVATDDGLLTPVLRDVDELTITSLSERIRDLGDRARARKLRQSELEGGTITVTNLGMYGTEEFAAIINPPHAAILAVGGVRAEPVVVDGAVEVGTVMRVTLSVDHRAVDGVPAAEWMRAFLELLEHPVRILA